MDQIVLDDGVVRLEDGSLLHLVWNHGVRIEASNARAAMEAVNKIAAGRRYPMLVDMAATNYVDHQARDVFAGPCAATRIALVGADPVDRALAAYQISAGPLPCPTRFFTSKTEAMAWLQEADSWDVDQAAAAS